MPRPSLAPPDAAPLREALRGIRFLLRRGGATVAETLTLDALPDPAANIAKRMMSEVEGLARTVDEATSTAAKGVLGGHDSLPDRLDEIVGHSTAPAEFGLAIYMALNAVLPRIGVNDAFVSEMSARSVFAGWRGSFVDGDPQDWAADLTLRLLSARVIRGAVSPANSAIGKFEPVALFAALLWMQSDRSETENESVLEAAADIAVARAPEIVTIVGSGDRSRIAALYRKYVDHV